MHIFKAHDLLSILSPATVVAALKQMFIQGAHVPLRNHHTIQTEAGSGTLLIMPAWNSNSAPKQFAGIKIVNVFPDNPSKGLPSIQGSYFLFSKNTGTPLAIMDGGTITLLRTAAASVLAATYLARENASRLLMIGTGRLAPFIIRAYTEILQIKHVSIWGRTSDKAKLLAHSLKNSAFSVTSVDDLTEAVVKADIISCATTSTSPLVYGEWLQAGQHIDLIGSFTPEMRETDDAVIQKSSIFVDTRDGVLSEAGDLIQPLKKGIFSPTDIYADLEELCRGDHPGRTKNDEITLFKSVGTSLEDLATAQLAFELANKDLK